MDCGGDFLLGSRADRNRGASPADDAFSSARGGLLSERVEKDVQMATDQSGIRAVFDRLSREKRDTDQSENRDHLFTLGDHTSHGFRLAA